MIFMGIKYLFTVSGLALWMFLSVVAAVLVFTVQNPASRPSPDPACQVKIWRYSNFIYIKKMHHPHPCFYCQVFTVWRDPSLLLPCPVYQEVFVHQATTVQRAAVYPHPALLAPTWMKLEEKAKKTANHALLVNESIAKLSFLLTLYKIPLFFWKCYYVWKSLPGWFQDLTGQKACNPCPPGFHCQSLSSGPTTGYSNGVSNPLPCPAGYTCPRESEDSQPLPCPKGSYSSSQGLTTTGKNPQYCKEKEVNTFCITLKNGLNTNSISFF